MKKSIIIVVVIAVLILGAFIFLGKQRAPQQTNNTNVESNSGMQGAIDTARLNAKQASMKAFVAGMMGDLAKYYGDVKNTALYNENPSVKQSIETKISALKEKYPGDYSYKIYDGEEVAIKLAETTSGIYVCADSITIKVVDINSTIFNSQTDCTGKAIK